MNKFQKLFKGLSLLIKRPSLINKIIRSEEAWSLHLKKHHRGIIQLPTVDIGEFVKDFQLSNYTFLGGGSLPTDILLLKNLAQKIPDCSYFEIGTWRGESVINIVEVAKECFTLNLSREEIISLGLSTRYADLHGILSKGNKNITHLEGNSMSFNFEGLQKKFDLIFIDGNHEYEYVKNDTEKVFQHLVHENTIVVWHDYAEHPEKSRKEVLSGILDGIPSTHLKHLYHVSHSLCAIYYPKPIESREIEFPMAPTTTFEIDLKRKEV